MDFVTHWISPEAGLIGLFVSAFISATLLPGGSEVLLFALIQAHPEQRMLALLVATVGNTLGGMTTYGCGWLLPQKMQAKLAPRALAWVKRYGVLALLLSWLPVIGDGLCLAAGWLRLNPGLSLLCMLLGKAARYALIAAY